MTTQEIQKLLSLDWKPVSYVFSNDNDFYIWKQFEISESKELYNYTDYTPGTDEKIYVVYIIYPNKKVAQWFIWRAEDNPIEAPLIDDDYETVIELALEDKLFTFNF